MSTALRASPDVMTDYQHRVAYLEGERDEDHVTIHAYRIKNNDTCDEVTACGQYIDWNWNSWRWIEQPAEKQVTCITCIARTDA